MTEQTVYTELIVLKFQDQAQAGMDAATASFERSADQIRSSLARIGPVAAEIGELAGGKFGLSWKAAFALWNDGVNQEKLVLKELQRYRKEMEAEALQDAKLAALDKMTFAKAMRQQEEAAAKEAAAMAKATTAEELDIAKALHQYRLESSREELDIARALNRYRIEGEAEVAAAVKAEATEELTIARELHRYRMEAKAQEVAAAKQAAAEELTIAKELHRYRLETMAQEAAAKKEQAAFMGGVPSGAARLTGGNGTNAAIGAAIVGFEAFEGAKKYNDALRDMGTLLNDASTSNFAFNVNLRETGALARDFSSRFNIDVVDVLKSFKEALSSGFDQGDLAKVGEVGAEMSRAMHVSMEESVDVLSTVRNAWKLSVDDMQGAGDRLFNMVNYGRVKMEEIRSSFGRVSATAAAAGLTFQDVAASLIVLTKDGQTNSQAVTALAAAINRVDTASDALKHKFELAGIASQDLDFHAHSLTSVLEKLRDVTHGNAEILHDLFPEAREYRGVVDLINHIDELKEAERGAAEQGTLLIASNRNLENGFDRLGGTAKGAWNTITSSISTALDKYYEWKDALTDKSGQDGAAAFAQGQLAKYGDLFTGSGESSQLANRGYGAGKSDKSLAARRAAIADGSMDQHSINDMQEAFNARIASEEGFAAKVKAMDDQRLHSQRAINIAAEEEKLIKSDLAANEKAMGDAALEREKVQKEMEKMSKRGGLAKAFPDMGSKAHDMGDAALAWLGLPDVTQVEEAVHHMREVGKKYLEEDHKSAKEYRDKLMRDAKHAREQQEAFEVDTGKELAAEMVAIYAKDEEDFKHFQEKKAKEVEKLNAKMLQDLQALGSVEKELHERMFAHGMKHAERGGKDPARAARMAKDAMESEEAKIKGAIDHGNLTEKDFARMIGEYRKYGDARSDALTRNKDGDRADREDKERDSVEQGMINAFKKLMGESTQHDIASVNGRTFGGKSRNEVAKEALQKVEAKHVEQVVNQNVTINTLGITTRDIQSMIDKTITTALADIKARGTGVTGRPTTSRGAPVGRGDDTDE